jgi:diaminopimelate epimerase
VLDSSFLILIFQLSKNLSSFCSLLATCSSVKFNIEMEKIIFTKMSGAGNDFVFIDKKQNDWLQVNTDFVQKICDRRNGIGADGLITIEDSSTHNFIMNYYNADGSTGSLCANGARCAILFASESGRLMNNKAEFISNDITYKGEVISNSGIKFYLNPPKKIKYNFKIKAGGRLLNAHFADTGSPHVVIDINESEGFLTSLDSIPLEKLGKEIRYLPEFSPGGTNVNFIEVKNGAINIRTYERGVEAETLACGTGSVAAALICFVTQKLSIPVKIIPKSNEKLFVNFDVENSKVRNLSLTGPVKVIFTGEMKF